VDRFGIRVPYTVEMLPECITLCRKQSSRCRSHGILRSSA